LTLAAWINRDFAKRMHLHERNFGPVLDFDCDLPSKRRRATDLFTAMRLISTGGYRDRGHIQVTHPYLHIPLVAFVQAIPLEQLVCPGKTRSLMRRSLSDLLPHAVLNRRSKRGPEEAFFRGLRREWATIQRVLENPVVARLGYVDSGLFRR